MKNTIFLITIMMLLSCGKTSMESNSSSSNAVTYTCSDVPACASTCHMYNTVSGTQEEINQCRAEKVQIVNGLVVKPANSLYTTHPNY